MTDQTKKQNSGKPPVFQGCFAYFPRALKEVAKVSVFGKEKYYVPLSAQGWRDVPLDDLQDAAARHMLDRAIEGEVNANDGDMLHLAQHAWQSLAALEIYLKLLEERAVREERAVSAQPGGFTFCNAEDPKVSKPWHSAPFTRVEEDTPRLSFPIFDSRTEEFYKEFGIPEYNKDHDPLLNIPEDEI